MYTSKYHNQIKENNVKQLLHTIVKIKNQSSQYVFDHKHLLLTNASIKELKNSYKLIKSDIILAYNISTEHDYIVDLYVNALKQHIKNLNIRLQDKIVIQRYASDTKYHKKGDIKSFQLKFHSTKLTNLIKYLVYLDYTKDIKEQLKCNETILAMYEYYESKGWIDRIVKLAQSKQQRMLAKLKLIRFGKEYSSLRLDYDLNQARIDYMPDNALYKYWFVFRMYKKNGEYRLPLQINDDYHNGKTPIAKIFTISLSPKNSSKINIATTCEVSEPTFKPFNKVVGMDLNLKHNFGVLSDGFVLDYDRDYMKRTVQALKELDKIGYQNLTTKQLQKLKKIHRQLDWYTSLLVHKLITYLKANNITDIVVEDLLLSGKFGINEEFGIKYARLSKLLHLSSVKDLLKKQAEKHGIRVHITPSQYTSLTCPKCGHISHDNRKTQEDFKCTQCGYEDNADHVAAQNIKTRLTSDVLRSKLHNLDKYGRLEPKRLNKYTIKTILDEYYASLSIEAPSYGQCTKQANVV